MTDTGPFDRHVDLACELALRGVGEVEPNPPVGAVVVRDGRVIGRGWHAHYGGPHAEVVALAEAGEGARGATVVVTLEPCSTVGKTPPCVDAVLAAGVTRVVVAAADPNPRHGGRGLSLLRERGVDVVGPLGTPDAVGLLSRFRRHLGSDRAYVVAKWASTLDGRVATRSGESRWISGEAARARVHRLRGRVDGIAVGRGTLDADDPSLTARPPGPRTPRRIVFDRRLTMRADWCGFTDGGPELVLIHGPDADPARRDDLLARGATLLQVGDGDLSSVAAAAARELRAHGIERILLEGGPTLLGAFFDAGIVDRVLVFVAPKVFGGAAPTAVGGKGVERIVDAPRFEKPRWDLAGDDAVFEAFVAPR